MEEVKKEVTPNTNEPSSPSLIDKAIAAAERLERANKASEEILKRHDELMTRQFLGGKTDAGSAVKPITEEDIIKENAAKIMSQVGFKMK